MHTPRDHHNNNGTKRPVHFAFVRPTSWRGWLMLAGFILVIVAGIWPVIGWLNRPSLVAGLPAIAAWSYVIVFSCCAVMALGNCLIEEGDDE